MPTDHTEQELVRVAVEGYEEHNRVSTKFFDCNGTTFELPNSSVHNLNAYLNEEANYILVPRARAERLRVTKQVEFEEDSR